MQGLPANIKVSYLLGGLAPDSNEPMPKAMQENIASYWHKIQAHIPGTSFNFDFWDKCQPRRSTYPACRAVIAAKNQAQKNEYTMISAVQEAYYLHAKNPSNDDTLVTLAETLGLDKERFIADLNSPETQQQLNAEISFSQKIGAQGFPSLILEKEGRYQFVPIDYNDSTVALKFILNSK